ncbi:phage tail tape measure protein [Clostridium tetani]|uniref:phage tail tape measure protein n=1 Tax=Clostridium tetani TaxID=1513 RepID=UPI00100BB951|nr:phage tail tape measure protein [Clostridium tetani]RXM57217.1 phage tail tape measure protein [Clostridium tetani]
MASNTEKRITAKMVLDSTGYNSSIKGINSEMKKHQSELKLASQGIKSFGKDSEKLKSVQESLSKQVELHSKKVDLYKQAMEKTTSKMKDNIKERDKLKESLDKANRKYDETVKLYGKESHEAKKAKKEVDNLTEEYKKKEKAVKSNARSIQNYETNMNKANAQVVKTKAELEKINNELARSNNKWLQASDGFKKSSERLKNVGSTISGVGDKILKLTAPLAAGGMAGLKFATDFENSIAKVSTIADTTQVPINDLRKGILKLSNDTGIASTEIAGNVYDAISAGQKTGDAVNFVGNSTKLAKAGFAEAGQSLDLLTTILNSYELEAKEVTRVSDILINTQNKGKVTVGELSASMGKVVPTAKAFGVNLEQVATGYAIMTAKGIKAAETTTYMNSMFNEMGKSGTKASDTIKEISGKSFQDLIKEGKSVGDILAMMKDHADKNKLSLADMFGSAEAGKAALILANNAGQDFNTMLKNMNNTAGATDKAFEKVTNTTGERFKKSLNKVKNEAIRLGDAIAPMMDKLSSGIGIIANKLNGLSKEQLDSYVKWGMIAIASGGALKVLGGGISTIGNIAGGLSKLTGWLGKASTGAKVAEGATKGLSLGTKALGLASKASTLALNPWSIAIAGVGIAGYATYKHLKKEAIPTVDLFADKVQYSTKKVKKANGEMEDSITKISEGTKKAVGAYMKLDENAKKHLTNLYINGTKITKDTADGIVKAYKDMGTQIKDGIDKDHKEQMKKMQEFFAKTQTITKEEQRQMFTSLQEHNDKQKVEIDQYEKEIQAILDKASKEKRELKADEMKKIDEIQEKMKVTAVETLSEEEVESKVILERLKAHSERLTAEQASEVIKNAEKQRQGAVNKAEKQYDETVRNIIKMRDESKTITHDQAEKLIEEAERQKKESIDKAGEMKKTVVEKIKEMNKDTMKNIDENDGHIKTKWENLKSWFKNNPILRNVKTVMQKSQAELEGVGRNWTGTNYWRGGLTYLHDQPGTNNNYELYDLPRGSRIYNHDASEDLVIKTAENVATKVANSVLKNFQGMESGGQEQTIIVPVNIDGREIARITAKPMSEELGKLNKRGGLGYV